MAVRWMLGTPDNTRRSVMRGYQPTALLLRGRLFRDKWGARRKGAARNVMAYQLAVNVTTLSLRRLYDGAKTMCPSACAIAGPAATYRTGAAAVQRMSMVLAPPSVATRRSPARIPACASCAADSCRTALSP